MDAVTICAVNYLPFAEVLGKSFLQHNVSSKFTIFVIDGERIPYSKNPNFNYLEPPDLEIDKKFFKNMAFYYDVTELATALKPSVIKTLFSRGSRKVIYLDPDIKVYDAFNELDAELDSHSIVLTPHNLKPIPRDGLRPTEADILGSGTFNLGFIGLSNSVEADSMLSWWEERLKFDSISDTMAMLFTDQRWIDLVPSYFSFSTFTHPGYNVAYWNLHERNLTFSNERYFVDALPLKFFHFSGYRPERPWILSKYVADGPRVTISKNTVLAKICSEYGEDTKTLGWSSETAVDYGFKNFENGDFIPSSLRRLYREDCIDAYRDGETLSPPENWQKWATERSVESGNLSRILFGIWKSRPDLNRRFPDATGKEATALQSWAKTHGIDEGVITEELTAIGGLQADSFPTKFSKDLGLNVSGYLKGELGLGQSARLILNAAKATGLPVTVLNSNRNTSRQNEEIRHASEQVIYPVSIVIVNADHFEFWVDDVGPDIAKKTYVIGVWAWETEDFPETMHKAFEYVDEIWAVSNFVKNAIERHTSKPVYVYPNQIEVPESDESFDFKKLGIPSNLKYNLFIFDYASVFNRKNPVGVVEAHKLAFPDCDGPALILKSNNGDQDAENRELLRYLVKDRPDIYLIEDYLSKRQLNSLLKGCETYVSLHRSEGYGLTMAEALAFGKPVIATGYSGNLDFMNEKNGILVPYTKVAVGRNSFPYLPDSTWAEPDITYASQKIRELYSNIELKSRLNLVASDSVVNHFNENNSVSFIMNRVNSFNTLSGKVRFRKKSFNQKTINFKFKVKRRMKQILS